MFDDYIKQETGSILDNTLFDRFGTRRKMEIVKFIDINNLKGHTPENAFVFLVGCILDMEEKLGQSFSRSYEGDSRLMDEIVDLRKLVELLREENRELKEAKNIIDQGRIINGDNN